MQDNHIFVKNDIARNNSMIVYKTIKNVFSALCFVAGAFVLYSNSKLEKKYAAIKRDNLRLERDINKLKNDVDDIANKIGINNLSDECICGSKAEGTRKYTHTVKEYNGIIGVFDGEGTLVKEVNITVDSLPDADKQDLLIGIRVYSSDELERILEEFN